MIIIMIIIIIADLRFGILINIARMSIQTRFNKRRLDSNKGLRDGGIGAKLSGV